MPKGMSLAFGMGGGKLSVTINEKSIGSISDKPLSQAFKGIYTDKNAVCKMIPVGDGSAESDGRVFAFVTPFNCVVSCAGVGIGYGIQRFLCKSKKD